MEKEGREIEVEEKDVRKKKILSGRNRGRRWKEWSRYAKGAHEVTDTLSLDTALFTGPGNEI